MAVVDASVFVALALPGDANHAAAVSWYHRVRRRRAQLTAPSILVAEVAAAVARASNDDATNDRAVDLLGSVVQLTPVSVRTVEP